MMRAGRVKETVVFFAQRIGLQRVQHVEKPLPVGKVRQAAEHHIGVGVDPFDNNVGDL